MNNIRHKMRTASYHCGMYASTMKPVSRYRSDFVWELLCKSLENSPPFEETTFTMDSIIAAITE